MEELKNEAMENEMLETVGEVCTEVCDDFYRESSKFGRNIVVGFVGAGITAAGAVAIARRDKIREWNDERMVKHLERRGYNVQEPIEYECVDAEEED